MDEMETWWQAARRMRRLTFGTAWEATCDKRGRIEVYAEPRDAWVGAYVARDAVYVCPLPFVVVRVSRGQVPDVE